MDGPVLCLFKMNFDFGIVNNNLLNFPPFNLSKNTVLEYEQSCCVGLVRLNCFENKCLLQFIYQ